MTEGQNYDINVKKLRTLNNYHLFSKERMGDGTAGYASPAIMGAATGGGGGEVATHA